MEYITLVISILALIISGLTFWLTKVKSGIIKMTRPTTIYLGPDQVGKGPPKIFIRTLLYSTSDKGKYIQNMHVRLQRSESVQNFNVWVYKESNYEPVRGSGLFVNKNGIVCAHHFYMPKDGTNYNFLAGKYLLQIYAESVDEASRKIFEQSLTLTKDEEEEMKRQKVGTYFDWAPNTQNYLSHVDTGPRKDEDLDNLIQRLTDGKE